MKMKTSKSDGGPSSAIGIMRFKDTAKGIQISPELIIGISIVVVIVVLFLRATLKL
jgi:preprotein translocase subunit Sec61beta